MSKATLALGLLLALAGVAPGGEPAEEPLPRSIAFWTPSRGLVGTDAGVELTTDGGRASRVVLRTSHAVTWVTVAGTRDAWAVIAECTSRPRCSARLLHSGDGGASWTTLPPRHVLAPSFASPRLGFDGGRFLRTSDGGRTWHGLRAPCSGDVRRLVRVDRRRGWVLCASVWGAGHGSKEIQRTIDGGRTWQPLARARPEPLVESGGLLSNGYADGVAFAPDGGGLLWEARGRLYATEDGGRTWHARRRVSVPDLDWGLSGWMLERGVGFALLLRHGKARLLATRDGGRTWRVVRRWR